MLAAGQAGVCHAMLAESRCAAAPGLRGKLPDTIKLPPSITVPFGAFEEVLNAAENRDVKQRLEQAVKNIPESHAEEALQQCHSIAMEASWPLHLCPCSGDCVARISICAAWHWLMCANWHAHARLHYAWCLRCQASQSPKQSNISQLQTCQIWDHCRVSHSTSGALIKVAQCRCKLRRRCRSS